MSEQNMRSDRYPVAIDDQLCTNCGMCLNSCPTDVFHINAQTERVEALYPRDCHVCFLCVADCPAGAIKVDWDAPNPRHRSVYDVLNMELVPFQVGAGD